MPKGVFTSNGFRATGGESATTGTIVKLTDIITAEYIEDGTGVVMESYPLKPAIGRAAAMVIDNKYVLFSLRFNNDTASTTVSICTIISALRPAADMTDVNFYTNQVAAGTFTLNATTGALEGTSCPIGNDFDLFAFYTLS